MHSVFCLTRGLVSDSIMGNIRLLTTVSIFFLPLTYVTSIVALTNMPTDQSYWIFGIVKVAICAPFFSLLAPLNDKRGFAFWERAMTYVLATLKGFVLSVRARLANGQSETGGHQAPPPLAYATPPSPTLMSSEALPSEPFRRLLRLQLAKKRDCDTESGP